MNTDHITATDLHRITTLEQRDGGMSIEFADDEPRDPWATFDAVLDAIYFWSPFAGIALGAFVAWAIFT